MQWAPYTNDKSILLVRINTLICKVHILNIIITHSVFLQNDVLTMLIFFFKRLIFKASRVLDQKHA